MNSLGPPTLLYVEDNADDVTLLALAAQRLEQPVTIQNAADVASACAFLETCEQSSGHLPPLLVITDFDLITGDALDLITWVRARSHLDRVAIVVCSDRFREDNFNQCYAAGADVCLMKPTTMPGLQRLLKDIAAGLRQQPPSIESLRRHGEYVPRSARPVPVPHVTPLSVRPQ